MRVLRARCQDLWSAIGLRGRLVAGYTVLFGVVLVGIAIGETTVVRQVLIDNRRAALPGAMNDLATFLRQPAGDQEQPAPFQAVGVSDGGSVLTYQGPLPGLTGNSAMVQALIDGEGSVISSVAGSEVRTVDPRQLLDDPQSSEDSVAPRIYQRTVGATTYLVAVHAIWMTSTAVTTGACAGPGCPPQTVVNMPDVNAPGPSPVTMLVAESLRAVDDTVHSLLLITLAASAVGLTLAAAIGLVVARRALLPLERMTATAQAIATDGDGALDRRLRLPAHGDEIGRLARTFDQMLDRIQDTMAERLRSETRLRHFAADASHELRTPLAALSGYTEALSLGGKDDPETTDHVLRQMHAELARMSRLVGDLLTLARLEAGVPLHVQALPVVPLL